MWKPMRHPGALLWIGLGLMSAFLLLCSCDEVERHRALTFFFDGVPPLSGRRIAPGPPGTNVVEATAGSQTGGWHVHKPLGNCTECHGSRQRQTSSRQVQLVASVPSLCYKCHQGYASLEGWVHGPVAVGECLLCHEPHKSRNEFLLVKPVPDLCFGCHESQSIRLIEGHARDSYGHCNNCHEGHSGATKSLLKPALLKGLAGQASLPEVRSDRGASPTEVQGTPVAAPRLPRDEREQQQIAPADQYFNSVKAYHAGRFAEAREGFLAILKSRASPQPMREMAKDYLEKIEWVQRKPDLLGSQPAR